MREDGDNSAQSDQMVSARVSVLHNTYKAPWFTILEPRPLIFKGNVSKNQSRNIGYQLIRDGKDAKGTRRTYGSSAQGPSTSLFV